MSGYLGPGEAKETRGDSWRVWAAFEGNENILKLVVLMDAQL